jgi:hypothetical protein
MRGLEEGNVAPFDAGPDAESAVVFLAPTAGVSLFLVVMLDAPGGLPAPVMTTYPGLAGTVETIVSVVFEGWAAKALLARLFRGTPILPAGTAGIASWVDAKLAGVLRPMPSSTKQVATKRRHLKRPMDDVLTVRGPKLCNG